jgi:hypothetical protein
MGGKRKMNKSLNIICLTLLLLVGMAAAQKVATTTTLYFNIQSVVAMTNTLVGAGATTATAAGAATTAVEFNTTNGTVNCVEAKVVGGTAQSTGNPIMSVDNTGTANINVSLNLNATMGACMNLVWKTTYVCDTAANLTATAASVVLDLTPAAAAQAVYLWNNFTACTLAEVTTRLLNVTGTNG